ncbi:MAG: hypothetical protein E7467_08655 [Ruminococcaceae bacterium]|nr:hypothetical protein [Oscillospiraceae bacterium]
MLDTLLANNPGSTSADPGLLYPLKCYAYLVVTDDSVRLGSGFLCRSVAHGFTDTPSLGYDMS